MNHLIKDNVDLVFVTIKCSFQHPLPPFIFFFLSPPFFLVLLSLPLKFFLLHLHKLNQSL